MGGVTTVRATRSLKIPYSVARTIRSPGRSSLRDQKGARYVVRCPAMPTLPVSCHGYAVSV